MTGKSEHFWPVHLEAPEALRGRLLRARVLSWASHSLAAVAAG
jgi:hypothetical protein